MPSEMSAYLHICEKEKLHYRMKLPFGILMTPENNLTNICTLDCRWYPVSAAGAAAAFMTLGNPIFNARAAMLSYRIPSFSSISLSLIRMWSFCHSKHEMKLVAIWSWCSIQCTSLRTANVNVHRKYVFTCTFDAEKRHHGQTDTHKESIIPKKHINYFLLTHKFGDSDGKKQCVSLRNSYQYLSPNSLP